MENVCLDMTVCMCIVQGSGNTVLDISVLDWNVAKCTAAADGCV